MHVWTSKQSSLSFHCLGTENQIDLTAGIFTTSAVSSVPILSPPPFLNFILFYVYGYFPWICILCLPDANRSQKKVLDHLELELEVVVRHHASGNWTCILYKSSSCSWLLSHLIWDPKENNLLKYVWWKIWKLYSTGKQKVVQFLKAIIIAYMWCDLFKFYFVFSNIKLMK